MTEETLWKAVLERDASARFVYAVKSTGVYCRPECPSRRPRRDRVEFFDTNERARAAGYRACLRCRPDGPTPVDQMRRWIESHETVQLEELASAVGLTKWHALRTFKAATGLTPREYAEARRVGRLRSALRSSNGVADAVYEAGYGSGSRVYEQSEKSLGMTPASYARSGKGAHIRFTILTTDLGEALIARTDRGICAVRIGDPQSLEREMRLEFSMAEITRDDAALGQEADVVRALASGRASDADLPLDVLGTAFQRKVWEQLRKIQRGERHTYSDVAHAIGKPDAVRAVANAIASNPVALVVPCHRVVRSDGDTGGYRWGESRKRRLIESEATP